MSTSQLVRTDPSGVHSSLGRIQGLVLRARAFPPTARTAAGQCALRLQPLLGALLLCFHGGASSGDTAGAQRKRSARLLGRAVVDDWSASCRSLRLLSLLTSGAAPLARRRSTGGGGWLRQRSALSLGAHISGNGTSGRPVSTDKKGAPQRGTRPERPRQSTSGSAVSTICRGKGLCPCAVDSPQDLCIHMGTSETERKHTADTERCR